MDFATEIKMHHATRAKAVRLIETLTAEYPRLTLEAVPGDDIDHETYTNELFGFEVLVDGEEVVLESDGPKVPELADILDACIEQEINPEANPEEGDEEEERGSGSVVPEKYRQQYREQSTTGQSCGDWLAEQLALDTLVADKLNVEALIGVFVNNGLDMNAPWALGRFTQSRGWQGRFRMSGRAVLEKQVLLTGTYFNALDEAITPSAGWLDAMAEKHGKWLAKQRKLQAEADVAVTEAVEGPTTTDTPEAE